MGKSNHLIRVALAILKLVVEIVLLIIRFIAALLFWTGYLIQHIGAFGLRYVP